MKIIKLVPDWKRVLTRSMSLWFGVTGLLLLPMPDMIFMFFGIDLDPVFVFWVIYGLLVVGVVGRLFQQNQNVYVEWARMVIILSSIFMIAFFSSSYVYAHPHSCEVVDTQESKALNVAVPLIGKWEGLRTKAYLDIVGVPTICYGSTRGVSLGMQKTKHQCDSLLRNEVSEYRSGWINYVNVQARNQWLPANRDAAYTSLAYNVGIVSAGRSTATRRLNTGNIQGGCVALGWWNRAGGRVVMGLVNRRSEETELCLSA